MEDETPSRETERGLRYLRVGVALVILIVGITILAANAPTASTSTATSGPPQPNPYASGPVNVTAILAVSSDNACGLNGSQQGGFHTPAHYSYVTFWWLPQHAASLPCTVENVTTNTTGFELSSSLPTTVTVNETAIMVDIYTPAAYNGTLYLIFR